MSDELLTVEDVAHTTQLSVYTVRAAIRDGELPASRLRGRYRIEPTDLADWIEAGRVQADDAPVDVPPVPAPRSRRVPPPGGARQAVRDRRSAA